MHRTVVIIIVVACLAAAAAVVALLRSGDETGGPQVEVGPDLLAEVRADQRVPQPGPPLDLDRFVEGIDGDPERGTAVFGGAPSSGPWGGLGTAAEVDASGQASPYLLHAAPQGVPPELWDAAVADLWERAAEFGGPPTVDGQFGMACGEPCPSYGQVVGDGDGTPLRALRFDVFSDDDGEGTHTVWFYLVDIDTDRIWRFEPEVFRESAQPTAAYLDALDRLERTLDERYAAAAAAGGTAPSDE